MPKCKDRISTAGVAEKNGTYFVALRKPGTSIGESWEFPGGKHRYGETPEQTLRREFLEEFNAEITVGERFFVGGFENKGTTYKLKAYRVTIHTPDDAMRYREHEAAAWKSAEELQTCRMADSDLQILSAIIAQRG